MPEYTSSGFCTEQYEPEARPHDTHTCDLFAGHKEWHHCGLCGSRWEKPGGRVAAAG